MKHLICACAIVLSLAVASEARNESRARYPTTQGKQVNVRQNVADTIFVIRNVDTMSITLESDYRNFMLWSDSDFGYNVGSEAPSDTRGVKVRTANGYFMHIREFTTGTTLRFDVLPFGANAAGAVAPIYGIAQKR